MRKFKNRLSSKEYYKLYPTSSYCGKFYGTGKIHRLPSNGCMEHLPLRPIVPNICTASCQLAKYLAKLLFPLSQSNYKINRPKDLTIKIRCERISENCYIPSFDVKSLFTLVPLGCITIK